MKQRFFILALTCFLGVTSLAFSDCHNNYNACDKDEVCPCAAPCGPCVMYCPVKRYKKQEYVVKKCVKEPYTVRKRCCRYVDRYYTVTKCRYVPQYYTETYCKKCPEYYYTCETCYRNRTVCQKKCCYVPYCTMEKRVVDCPVAQPCPAPCPKPCPAPCTSGGCSSGSCAR